ncbi:transglutaminase domain-containing protein [Candidatus Woesearchaeota archaeon]|nr:transglutaminase domain-containing protein [Candidatus Woesearchaeota archaeon]
MKKVSLFFFAWVLVLLLVWPSALAVDSSSLFAQHSLDLELSIENDFDILSRGTSHHVQKVSAEMFWFPREDYRQEVDYINTDPLSNYVNGQSFEYSWASPAIGSYVIRQFSKVNTKNEFFQVKKKIDFPITGLDPAYSSYLQPREIIDINDRIRSVASRLAEGEDDEYMVLYNIARWVEENIDYDLNTLTADASQKASWVMQNRKGVCDELTSLFIAMTRSLGIPARFVSGVSYSNINQQNEGWGPHGWAEVYFPDIGWVPFDVTYKQLGYVDATHVKLVTSTDAKGSSVEYSIIGQNVDIHAGSLRFDADVLGQNYLDNPPVKLEAKISKDMVGFGSYNLLTLTVKNLHSYYVTGRLQLSEIKELSILDGSKAYYIIPPYGETKIYWLLKVKDGLSSGYLYTFPLSIMGDLGEEASASFKVNSRSAVYSKEFMNSQIPSSKDSKPYSDFLEASCSSDKAEVYLGEQARVSCTLKNTGSKSLSNLKTCFEKECSYVDLPTGEEKSFSYLTSFQTLGIKTMTFNSENSMASKTAYLVIPVQDEPLVNVYNLTYPQEMSYKDGAELRFWIKRDSMNAPKNVVVKLDHDLIQEQWDFKELETNYEIRFLFKGENLHLDRNDFNLSITYEDAKGKTYKSQEEFSIELITDSFMQKVFVWINIADIKTTRWLKQFIS